MATKEALNEESKSFPVNLHGSLIVQELLHFKKPIKVVSSLLKAFGPKALGELLSDVRGNHITEAFVSSETIGEKSRDGLVKGLKVSLDL